ncbi:polyprenyl synthetase family protein [Microbispora triticiradicis]|uniref:Polyprenyl synthetase family protein n=2 Tax=Microbispora TaxID=2005 RepID=A0ABY3LN72_9ACTN|nr:MULTISPECIES: polyprenyl synthetase family protein [Microbispora]TLP50918.1 polyprenyl synthetase family protein [Microbispora fusca]TYB43833.1 polyprenyl synthetase family protein [Microbispora tritici]
MPLSTTSPPAGTEAAELRRRLVADAEDRIHRLLDLETEKWTAAGGRPAELVASVRRIVDAGGKRLRPAFCVTGYLSAGGDPGSGDDVVRAAAALELLHVFALIHDDVLDDSAVRRGAETVHSTYASDHLRRGMLGEPRRYGEGVAILAGDLAHVYADGMAAQLPPAARQIWTELRTEMIVGQFLDVLAAAEALMDVRTARWIAVCKSGHYTIHRPLTLGAAVAGRTDLNGVFQRYGALVGEAFQLRDDLIDVTGDSGITGKPTGLDAARHKMTLLLALAAEKDDRVRKLVGAPAREHDAAERLHTLLRECGVVDDVERLIQELVDDACAVIREAPLDREWREELIEMAHRVAYRDH